MCYTFKVVKRRIVAAMIKDLREIPIYTPTDAARYLRISVNTLRYWLLGKSKSRDADPRPLINIADTGPTLLSFNNLVESHVLLALRRKYRIKMPIIRKALAYLQQEYQSRHPLLEDKLQTDGKHLFIQKLTDLEIISQDGQLGMREVLEECLGRIELDEHDLPFRYYPYTRDPSKSDPRLVIIDPWVSFGRPTIKGSGIPTVIIAERFEAGEGIESLVEDYGRTSEEIEEAIRWQRQAA